MRTGTKVTLGAILGFGAGIGATLGVQALYEADGFIKNSLDMVFMPPHTTTKVLTLVAALLTFAALPFGIMEWTADRRFRRAERAMRESRPLDEVKPYEGPEGRGLLFEGPFGRALLLEPAAGMGQPRVLELPAPEEPSPLPPDEVMGT